MAEDNTSDFDEEKEGAEAEAAAKLEAEKSEEGTEEEVKEEDKKDGEDEKEEKYDENEEPPTRKSIQDHIIERKDKKIEKLENKEKEELEEDEESPLSEEDQKAINKVVSKETEPLKEVLKAQSDKNDLDAVILKHPEAKAMEKRIMKYARHKSYQDIPMENIYLMLANGKSNLQAKKTEAKENDKENATIGHTKRKKSGGEPDYKNMSDEEFDKVDRELMEGQL